MNEEYRRLKEALKQPPTPEAMKEAAQRFREFEQAKAALGRRRSRPTLVSLGFRKDYPTQIDVRDIPSELERNPAFYEQLRKIVEEG